MKQFVYVYSGDCKKTLLTRNALGCLPPILYGITNHHQWLEVDWAESYLLKKEWQSSLLGLSDMAFEKAITASAHISEQLVTA